MPRAPLSRLTRVRSFRVPTGSRRFGFVAGLVLGSFRSPGRGSCDRPSPGRARPGSSSSNVSPPQSCFVTLLLVTFRARELTCQGFVPIRDLTGAVHFHEAAMLSLRSVHRLSRPLDGLLRLRFAGLFRPAATSGISPFEDSTRSLADSSPVAAPLPLASVRSPGKPGVHSQAHRLRGFHPRAVCVSGLALPFPFARPFRVRPPPGAPFPAVGSVARAIRSWPLLSGPSLARSPRSLPSASCQLGNWLFCLQSADLLEVSSLPDSLEAGEAPPLPGDQIGRAHV